MVAGVADTHAAIWFLFGDPRLSSLAKAFFEEAAFGRRKIVVAPISLAEVVYLTEKGRLPASAFGDLRAALNTPNHLLEEGPFTADVVDAMRQISRAAVPDMPNRIVSATAVFLGVPLITRDSKIRASGLKTIW